MLTHTHTYSGRADHGGAVEPQVSYQRLARWAAEQGIDALAMGSPYAPKSAANYRRYDGPERDAYYHPDFDRRSVMDADELQAMLSEVTRYSDGRTLFFLDNETPKGRYGHLWWVGYHADMPPWHDYDQPFDRWMTAESRPEDYRDEPMAYARRPYLEILGIQRSHGAIGFWAHPTSWWLGTGGQFITNIATEMPAHLLADGFLDGLVVMGYQPYRPQYQAIWFALLDRGYRVPGVAEMDVGLSDAALWQRKDPMLTYISPPGAEVGPASLVAAFKTGRLFASSGPFVDLSVDGRQMGEVAKTSPDTVHRVRLTAFPGTGDAPLPRVELVGRGGEVIWSRDNFASGTVEIPISGLRQRGYLVARVFGTEGDGQQWRRIRHFAVSNPVYLHPAGESFTSPLRTEVHLNIAADSRFHGGQIRFESMSGELLGTAAARGSVTEALPASARLTLVADGVSQTHYLLNANAALQDVQRYLYRGRFLRDFPSLVSGELPPEAWRLDDYAKAMRRLELSF